MTHIHTHAHTHTQQARKMTKELYSQEGCHPLKVAMLPWVQLPLWIVISFALRNMTGSYPSAYPPPPHVLQAFHTEGALWFPDLTMPDPCTVLPVLLVVTNLLNIEVRQTLPPLLALCSALHHFTAWGSFMPSEEKLRLLLGSRQLCQTSFGFSLWVWD